MIPKSMMSNVVALWVSLYQLEGTGFLFLDCRLYLNTSFRSKSLGCDTLKLNIVTTEICLHC